MATSSLRPYGYDAYVEAITTDTFLINTNTTVYTAPAACSKVEWALTITQSAASTQTNYASFAVMVGDDVNALYAADVGDGQYGLSSTYVGGWTSQGSLIGSYRANTTTAEPYWPALDPGQSIYLRWSKSNGSPGTMRWTLRVRVYQ